MALQDLLGMGYVIVIVLSERALIVRPGPKAYAARLTNRSCDCNAMVVYATALQSQHNALRRNTTTLSPKLDGHNQHRYLFESHIGTFGAMRFQKSHLSPLPPSHVLALTSRKSFLNPGS
jgi:hypothetical protein